MRRYILIGIAALFYYSGLMHLARWRTSRAGRSLVVLNYHRASGGDLRRHLLHLRKHYRILHVEEALEALYSLQQDKQWASDRRIPLVLTFDDGYTDNYTHGFALARELQVPMTIYLVPGYIESGGYFWWVDSKRLVQRANVRDVEIDGQTYRLDHPGEQSTLASKIDARVRFATSVSERETFLAAVREKLAVPSAVPEEDLPALPLTWELVLEMQESGWISFGAHTMHHPILAYLTDAEEVEREVAECRTVLERRLGRPVRSFAYPVGQQQHIGDAVKNAVQRAGYDWALTTTYGFNSPSSDRYLLKRVECDVDQHWLVVAAEAAGLWGFFSRLRWLPFIRKNFSNSN